MDLDIKPDRMAPAPAGPHVKRSVKWLGAAIVIAIAGTVILAGRGDLMRAASVRVDAEAAWNSAKASLSHLASPSVHPAEPTDVRQPASSFGLPEVEPVIGPADTVRQLSALDAGGWEPIFSNKGIPYLPHFFTKSFCSDWKRAIDAGGNLLDGDPLTFRASSEGMRITDAVETIKGDEAEVEATFDETIEGKTTRGRLAKFSLKVENRIWKVDEITLRDKYAKTPLHRYLVQYRDDPDK